MTHLFPDGPYMEIGRSRFPLMAAAGATGDHDRAGLALAWAAGARTVSARRLLLETLVFVAAGDAAGRTGLILLLLCSPRGPLGPLLAMLGIEIVFTWKAVLLAMSVMGLPLFVRTVMPASSRWTDVTIGGGDARRRAVRVFLTITLPLPGRRCWRRDARFRPREKVGDSARPIVIAGSIPGATRTLSVAIYTFTETGRAIARPRSCSRSPRPCLCRPVAVGTAGRRCAPGDPARLFAVAAGTFVLEMRVS